MMSIDVIRKKYGNEQAVVVLLCRVFVGTATSDELNSFLSANPIDWEQLYLVIYKNKIRPVANYVFSSAQVPAHFRERLNKDNIAITVKSIAHLGELIRMSEKIKAAGVNVLPYKGLVFSAAYYGNYSYREFTDLDFLILLKDKSDLEKLYDLFKAEGYEPMHNNPDEIQETIIRNTCEFYFNKYGKEGRKFHADFHWACHHPVFDLPEVLPNKLLFDQPVTIEISGKQIQMLNANHNFITIVLHHGVRENWNSLKYILDLAQIMKTGALDWPYLNNVSETYKFKKVQSSGVQLVKELLGIEMDIPGGEVPDTGEYMETLLSGKPKRRPLFYKQMRKIRLMDDNIARLKMIRNTAYYSFQPSILDYKFLPLPKRLHFLYLFVKLTRALVAPFNKK